MDNVSGKMVIGIRHEEVLMKKAVVIGLVLVLLAVLAGCCGEPKLQVANDVIAMDVAEDWLSETGGDSTMLGGQVSAKFYPYTYNEGKWVVTFHYYPAGQGQQPSMETVYVTIATKNYVVQEIYWSDNRGVRQ